MIKMLITQEDTPLEHYLYSNKRPYTGQKLIQRKKTGIHSFG